MNDNLTDQELNEMETRANNASIGPWKSYVEGRDHDSGDSFIMVGPEDGRLEDMYISRGHAPADKEDLDFIANARQDIPKLVAEVRRLKSL